MENEIRTKEQIENYVRLRKEGIAYLKEQKEKIMSPDWPLALEFGEEVRHNHMEATARKIEHLQKQIINALMHNTY